MEGALSLTRQASATEMAYRETLALISSNIEVVEQVDFEHVLTTDVRVVAKAFSPQKTNWLSQIVWDLEIFTDLQRSSDVT